MQCVTAAIINLFQNEYSLASSKQNMFKVFAQYRLIQKKKYNANNDGK